MPSTTPGYRINKPETAPTPETVAPPPAAAPAEPPPTPITPTAEELAARAQDVLSSFFGEKPAKSPTEAPPEPPAKPEGATGPVTPAAPETPPTTPPAAPATPPKVESEPEPMSTTDLISKTAKATADAMASRRQEPEPPRPEPEPQTMPEMGSDDAEDYAALQYLENKDSRYAGLPAKFLAFVKALSEYRAKWESEHPGEDYDPDATEHEAFYSRHEPDINTKVLEQAKIDMRVDARVAQAVEPELEKIRSKEAWEAALPRVVQNIDRAIVTMVDRAAPELGKLLKDANGNPVLTAESLSKLDEADPIAKAIFDAMAGKGLKPILLELERIATPELKIRLNPDKNPIHAAIETYRAKMEKDMRSAPESVRTQDGREWMSIAAFSQKEQAIQRGAGTFAEKGEKIQALHDRYWTLTVDNIAEIVTHDIATQAKQLIEETDKLAARKYGVSKKSDQNPAPKPSAAVADPGAIPPVTAQTKPKPPSFSSQTEVVTTPSTPTSKQKSFGETATEVMFT